MAAMALFTLGSKAVSMKSGLRDRNNGKVIPVFYGHNMVSMKSGLRDRNNDTGVMAGTVNAHGLNEVRS